MSGSSQTITPSILSQSQVQIIRALLYFDIFSYPLTAQELYENVPVQIARPAFDTELEYLLGNGLLKSEQGFILSPWASSESIRRRVAGNIGAEKIMPTAYHYSRRIASFPFVEGVYLSGALSKNYFDENGDIDFFIVTKPGRLWICRTLLILRYKMLPRHKKKFWCTNYFISSDNLAIEDRNAFTGTELAHLVPTVNYNIYAGIRQSNAWCSLSFPNKAPASAERCIETPKPATKKMTELFFSGRFGEWVDDVLLSVTLRHWLNKYPEMAMKDFELQFRSRKNVCKRHTTGYQQRVLEAWEQKQARFEKTFLIRLG